MHRLLLVGLLCLILIGYYLYKSNNAKDKVPEPIVQPKIVDVEKPKKKPLSVTKKKQRYLDMMVPALNEVYNNLDNQYREIKQLLQIDQTSTIITNLKRKYKVQSNEELLIALKPHPKSIALAQGAMESAWGTSRFYKEAYNIFGVWSFTEKDNRIAAGSQRGDKTIWLKKYNSVKASLEDYYLTLSRSKAFKEFKKLNYETKHQNPYLLVKKLDRYSEKGALYGQELAQMIDYNRFVRFDGASYDKPYDAVAKKEEIPQSSHQPMESQKVVADEKAQQTITQVNKNVDLEAVTDALADSEDSFGDILKNIQQEHVATPNEQENMIPVPEDKKVNESATKEVTKKVETQNELMTETQKDSVIEEVKVTKKAQE